MNEWTNKRINEQDIFLWIALRVEKKIHSIVRASIFLTIENRLKKDKKKKQTKGNVLNYIQLFSKLIQQICYIFFFYPFQFLMHWSMWGEGRVVYGSMCAPSLEPQITYNASIATVYTSLTVNRPICLFCIYLSIYSIFIAMPRMFYRTT